MMAICGCDCIEAINEEVIYEGLKFGLKRLQREMTMCCVKRRREI